MYCKKCGAELPEGTPKCPKCGTITFMYGMKWFKFLVFFALWFGGILNIISGFFSILTFNAIVTTYGVLILALGILQIFTRFQLVQFKKRGPTLLYFCYVGNIILPIIVCLLTDNKLSTYSFNMAFSALMLFLNILYFTKRKDLFVNE